MNLIQGFLRARRRRLAVRDLRGLSSEQLRDIGIEPGGIDPAVSKMLGYPSDAKPTSEPPKPDGRLFEAAVLTRGHWPYPRPRSAA